MEFPNFPIFTSRCLDVRFWDFLCLICLKFNPHISIFFFAGRNYVDLAFVFNKGREETFAVSSKYCESCVRIKYLTLAGPRKLISVNFALLYSMWNAHNCSIAKKLFTSQFFKQMKLCLCLFLFKKNTPKKCSCQL